MRASYVDVLKGNCRSNIPVPDPLHCSDVIVNKATGDEPHGGNIIVDRRMWRMDECGHSALEDKQISIRSS
jgi:hypothetical protein